MMQDIGYIHALYRDSNATNPLAAISAVSQCDADTMRC